LGEGEMTPEELGIRIVIFAFAIGCLYWMGEG
jgi:hypothetical protein